MGKMTDALRKAKLLKDQREGRVSAEAEVLAAPPSPAPAIASEKSKPAEPTPVRIASVVLPPSPPPREELLAVVPPASIIETEPDADAEMELQDIASLSIIEEPIEEVAPPPPAPKPEPEVRRPKAVEPPKPAKRSAFVFQTVDERPAPPPKPEVKVEPVVAEAMADKPVAEIVAVEPVVVIEPPAPAVVEPAPVAPVAAVPAPVLPEVEPTPKPSHLPYLSVHYGRDEKLCDAFRRLKARLNEESPARLILVTSARPGEGKTTVALNLAASYANTFGEKVVVVDGNAAQPKITELLEAPAGSLGLSGAVRGRASAGDFAVETGIRNLFLVPPGEEKRRDGLLDSDGMRSLLAELRKHFTRVIVELPAAQDLPEGLSLAAQADVVLVPVLRSRSRRKTVKRLVETLKNRGASRVRCVFLDA
jgi:Mrp family chromosome partitioning ATPase